MLKYGATSPAKIPKDTQFAMVESYDMLWPNHVLVGWHCTSKSKNKKTLFKVGTVKNNKTVALICNKC